jgi:hypothetical protein
VIRVLDVSRKLIDTCDVDMVEQLFGELDGDPELARMHQGGFGLRFPEQEEKEMFLFLDPAVRAWGMRVHEAVPHLLYYLYPGSDGLSLRQMIGSFIPIEEIELGSKEEMDSQVFALQLPLLSERITAAARFAEGIADDWQRMLEALVDPLSPSLAEAVKDAVEASMREECDSGS